MKKMIILKTKTNNHTFNYEGKIDLQIDEEFIYVSGLYTFDVNLMLNNPMFTRLMEPSKVLDKFYIEDVLSIIGV
jgi:hypothetical protein